MSSSQEANVFLAGRQYSIYPSRVRCGAHVGLEVDVLRNLEPSHPVRPAGKMILDY